MNASEALLMAGIILLAHELNPALRIMLGASIGLWGVIATMAGV
jgi:hypothetical protein